MSSEVIKRINPRRPFHVTAEGLKRIVLGEIGGGSASAPLAAHRHDAPKPLRLQLDPTAYHLVITHADRGALDAHAHQAIAAAALLADKSTAVVVLVLGELTEDLSPFGADTVFAVPSRDAAIFDPAADLALALDLITRFDPSHILVPDNGGASSDLGRRLAAKLAAPVASHVVELKADAVASYWQGGASMARRDLPKIILLDPDTTDTALPFRGLGERADQPVPSATANPYADLGSPPVDFAQLGLEEADFIVSAGNGVGDVPTLQAVAKAFDAAIGASRVAVDDGKFRRDQQIGATGKTVSASVYLAIGISGAVQHLQGIKAVRHVIAINTDASAPIAGRADLTIVDDAQAVMEGLLEAIRGRNFVETVPHTPTSPSPSQGEARWGSIAKSSPADQIDFGAEPPPGLPLSGGGTDRVPGGVRTIVLAGLGRNPVNGSARPNRDDLLALEVARVLGHTTVLHAGNPDEPALTDYLAYGTTTLDVVPATPGQDIASLLADRAGGADLILTGTRAEGGEGSGLVPYLVAERLGWPVVAQALEISIADGHAEITQGLAKGQRRHIRVRLPAVIAVHPKAAVTPRYAYARRLAGKVVPHEATVAAATDTAWRVEPATKRPVKFKAKEQKAGHARMLSAIVAEAKGGAVIATGSPADKAQAILAYLRTHKLIDW